MMISFLEYFEGIDSYIQPHRNTESLTVYTYTTRSEMTTVCFDNDVGGDGGRGGGRGRRGGEGGPSVCIFSNQIATPAIFSP